MISYLSGTVFKKNEKSAIVLVNGVGYEVFLIPKTLAELNLQEPAEFLTYLDVKETSWNLYGFIDEETLNFFKLLLTISGIGPKSALNILSRAELATLWEAIAVNSPDLLVKTSGIGKKTAEAVVNQLKDKIGWYVSMVGGDLANSANTEVIEALANLGYDISRIRGVLSKISPEAKTLEEKIRESLKLI